MATASSNMKGFYRQKKTAISKKSTKSIKSLSKSSPTNVATVGSDVIQPPALFSKHASLDLHDDNDRKEEVLRQFDMNMAYGPCLGMTRMQRWERARRLGINPPEEIEDLLLMVGKVRQDCLWDGRV